jgi:hypothetical protein
MPLPHQVARVRLGTWPEGKRHAARSSRCGVQECGTSLGSAPSPSLPVRSSSSCPSELADLKQITATSEPVFHLHSETLTTQKLSRCGGAVPLRRAGERTKWPRPLARPAAGPPVFGLAPPLSGGAGERRGRRRAEGLP